MSDAQSRLERRSVKALESCGYECLRLTGRDRWNILALSQTDAILVKVARDAPTPEETEDLKSLRCPENCRKIIHRWRRRARLPDVLVL